MRGFATDLRQALRGLARSPGVSLFVVFTLALGIGAPTAVFAVVNAALLRPLPYPHADRLVAMETLTDGGAPGGASGGAVVAWQEQTHSFAAVAAYRFQGFALRGVDGPERIPGADVTSSFFAVLETPPILGRVPAAGGRAAVLSEGLWRSRFGATREILAQTIVLNGEALPVAAVMPQSFSFPGGADLWTTPRGKVPLHPLRPTEDSAHNWGSYYLQAVGRLGPDTSLGAARAEMAALRVRLDAEHPDEKTVPRLTPLRDAIVGDTRDPLLILLGAVAVILLIACVNVAHLLLARAVKRQHEVAIRLALGAGRGRVARLFFAESVVLAAAAGLAGTTLALWGAPALAALAPAGLPADALRVDARVLAFASAIALVAAVAFSVLPAVSGLASVGALQEGSRGATAGARGRRLRTALMTVEVALAVVLLVGAGLLVKSLGRLQGVDVGFRPEGVLTADVNLPPAKYGEPAARVRFLDAVLERLRAHPDVDSVGAVSRLPLAPGNSSRDVDFERNGKAERVNADLRVATPDYFAGLGVPLGAGRAFAPGDVAEAPRVAIVNELFARTAWPGENPLGKWVVVTLDGKRAEVTGVVGNVLHVGVDSPPRPEVYVPYAVDPWPFMTLVVRGRVPPERLVAALRAEVAAVDPDQALNRVSTMEQRIAGSLAGRRFSTLLVGVSAAVALLLALAGIYGVIAYSVAQRRQEMGIRLALGAQRARLVGAVMAQSLRPVAAGVGLGVAAALGATRALATMLFGVDTTDVPTYATIVALAVAAAALASFAAARRVARVDPMTALRG
ncbi:MAG TPA: ABC transporter permease [Haliangiales bacterium]|nr:ABC transporter permease [Haliangiales bacterium]